MKANEIQEPLKRFISEENPYRCILIDGAWGIGKTFEVTKALEGKEKVAYVSCFGLENTQDIFRELLLTRVIKDDKVIKKSRFPHNKNSLNEAVSDLNILGIPVGKIFNYVGGFFTPKNLCGIIKKYEKEQSLPILVIDDIERLDEKMSLTDLLGTVEYMLVQSMCRVILIAYKDEIEGDNKKVLDRYNEKVISKNYKIDAVSDDFLRSNDDLEKWMCLEHKITNIRTLNKAKEFTKDVESQIEDKIENVEFIKHIRKTCFSIVFESIDNIYLKTPDEIEKTTDSTMRTFMALENSLEKRIANNYIHCFSDAILCSLLEVILDYYNKGVNLDKTSIFALEKQFIEKKKWIYFKSQEQIKYDMIELKQRILNLDGSLTLHDIDSFYVWSDIFSIDNKGIERETCECLKSIIIKTIEKRFIPVAYNPYLNPMQDEKMKLIYKEIYEESFNNKLEQIFDEGACYINEKNFHKLYEEFIIALRDNSSSPTLQNVFIKKLPCLLQDELFPKGEIDEEQFYCFRTIYKICYQLIPEELEKRKNEIIGKYPEDIMLKKRIKDFEEQEKIDFKAKAMQK